MSTIAAWTEDELTDFVNALPSVNLPGPRGATGSTGATATASAATFINVKDAAYGAIGDDSTDDTTAIQAALDAVHSTYGGTVYFPPGVYKITAGLTVKNFTKIMGAGVATSIKAYSGISTSPIIDGNVRKGIKIQDIHIDGNDVASYGIRIISTGTAGEHSWVDRCWVENILLDCIVIGNSAGGTGYGVHITRCRLNPDQSASGTASTRGIACYDTDNLIAFNIIHGFNNVGIYFDTAGGQQVIGNHIVGRIISNASGPWCRGLHAVQGNGMNIQGNYFDTFKQNYAIHIVASASASVNRITIGGNWFLNGAQQSRDATPVAQDAIYSTIYIDNSNNIGSASFGVGKVNITGNTAIGGSTTARAKNFVESVGDCGAILISDLYAQNYADLVVNLSPPAETSSSITITDSDNDNVDGVLVYVVIDQSTATHHFGHFEFVSPTNVNGMGTIKNGGATFVVKDDDAAAANGTVLTVLAAEGGFQSDMTGALPCYVQTGVKDKFFKIINAAASAPSVYFDEDAANTYARFLAEMVDNANETVLAYNFQSFSVGNNVWFHDGTSEINMGQGNMSARAKVVQSLSDDTDTLFLFDQELYDEAKGHSITSNTGRFIVPTHGYYLCIGDASWAADADGYRQLMIRVNGSRDVAKQKAPASAAGTSETNICKVLYLYKNDYVELWGHHTAGGAINVTPQFSVSRMA